MSFKKIKLICITILVSIISIPVCIWNRPVKYAIKEENVDKTRGYIPFILYKESIMFDSNHYNGLYEYGYSVEFTAEGNMEEFNKLNSKVRAAPNSYIFYGKYDETIANELRAKGIYKKERQGDEGTPIFYVDDWEIIYPISRENDSRTWFNPKNYLTKRDFD